MKNIIYADNAATTKLDSEAFEAMKPFLLEDYSNPSQPYSFSRNAKKAIKDSREIIARCINALPEEIYFTSGGTESDNWAIKGTVFNSISNKIIVTSEIEHHAVLNSCRALKQIGYKTFFLKPDNYGTITADNLKQSIDNASIVSIMYANNEIGTIQPVSELAEIAHEYGAYFHTDAVQAIGHIPIDVKSLNIDMLSASAHKFNGPKGIGFLYVKNGIQLPALINGGAQEFRMRAGTENVAAIVGMAKALKNNCVNIESNIKKIKDISKSFLDNLTVDYILNGNATNRLAGINSISLKDISGEALLHLLDLKGICVSTGSACDSVNTQISHVLKAIKVPNKYAEGTIRVSFGKYNTKDEAEKIADEINKIAALKK